MFSQKKLDKIFKCRTQNDVKFYESLSQLIDESEDKIDPKIILALFAIKTQEYEKETENLAKEILQNNN